KKEVYAGAIRSVKSADSRWVKEIDTSTPPLSDETPGSGGNGGQENNGGGNGSDTQLPPPIQAPTDQPIASDNDATYDEEGNPIITDNNGTRYVVPPGQTATIVNSAGEQQIVAGRTPSNGETAGGGGTGTDNS